ncbi:MAG: ClcB-like voltage-gated chloride channel protein [Methylacidiphilales bacterium]|nr:ClcB-like voltage-gated chloride channel protein [Candidatus Methylacidiphilales bacterium]
MNNPPPAEINSQTGAPAPKRRFLSRLLVPLLRLRVWLMERGPGDIGESNYFWAVVVGLAGACSSVAFREALRFLERTLLHNDSPLEYAAGTLPWWGRLLFPALGGLIAGSILLLGDKWSHAGRAADFMEAVVVGNGVIRVRATVVKSFSSLVTISTGGSIGREGPMVQLASMLGSLMGRMAKFSPARLRLLVACGAAAGIACAYNAPLTGAFFVAEIVLGSIAMESIGPLIVTSVVATVVASQFLGAQPIYRMPDFGTVPNWQLAAHALLGVFAGLVAPLFLLLLRGGESLFKRTNLPVPLKLGLGGLVVGVISLWQPAMWNGGGVWGNGYGVVESVLNSQWIWFGLLTILICKVLATVATTGSGAVGGVFTPTLFCGAILGSLFGEGLNALLPQSHIPVGSYAVVGMGCFLAATTRAPIMSILIMFEMTHNDATIMPLMLACVAAFYVARSISEESVYGRQLHANHIHAEVPIFLLHVRNLMKLDPVCVLATSGFHQVAGILAAHTFKHLYVVDVHRRFLGAIALQDLKPFLHETNLSDVVIALDIMHDDIPVLTGDASLKESLEVFARHDGERLPVIDNSRDRRLIGSLAKTDVLLTLAHGAGVGEAGSL